MPPFSCAATSMPMMRSKSEVLPWSTWPRKVTIGGRGCSAAGSSACSSWRRAACLPGRPRGGNRPRRPTPRPAARPFRRRGWRRCCSWCPWPGVCPGWRGPARRRPRRRLRTVQGRVDDDFALARRGGVGAGAADVGAGAGAAAAVDDCPLLRRRRGCGRRPPASASVAAARVRPASPAALPFPRPAAARPRCAAAARGRQRAFGRRAGRLRRRRRPASAARPAWRPASSLPSSPRACGGARRAACSRCAVARMASAGSLMSGFCGGRLLGFAFAGGWTAEGTGASFMAGPALLLFRRLGRRRLSSAGFFFATAAFSVLPAEHRHLSRQRARRGNVVLAAEGLGRAGRRGSLRGAGRGPGLGPRPGRPARRP